MTTRSLTVVKMNGEIKLAQPSYGEGFPYLQGVCTLNFLLNEMDKEKFIQKLNTGNYCETFSLKKRPVQIDGSEILKYIQNLKGNIASYDFEDGKVPIYYEYAYLIDFDDNTFEIYAKNRQSIKNMGTSKKDGFEYLNLLRRYDLNNLPSISNFKDTFDII